MYVKPNPEMKIFDPDLRDFLPEKGRRVPDTPYWQRLERDKDVIETDPPAEE